MKKLYKTVAAVALSVGALGLAQNAAAVDTKVQYSSGGTGVYDTTGITSFDWEDNQSVVIEQVYVGATGAGGAACGATPSLVCFFANTAIGDTLTFNLHAQAKLETFSNGVPTDSPVGFEITAVLDIVETAMVIDDGSISGNIVISFTSATGTYEFFHDVADNASQESGAGFTDGVSILSGSVVSSDGFFAGPDGLGGGGFGSSFLDLSIDSYDSMYIEADEPGCGVPGTCLIGASFNSTLDLSFGVAPFLGDGLDCTIGGADAGTCVIGAAPYAYLEDFDLLLAADATTQFQRLPTPGTTLLIGLGLLGLAGTRRRKS